MLERSRSEVQVEVADAASVREELEFGLKAVGVVVGSVAALWAALQGLKLLGL